MQCEKCKGKQLERTKVTEIKCKVCNKKIKARFTNICYNCQTKGYCIICGAKNTQE